MLSSCSNAEVVLAHLGCPSLHRAKHFLVRAREDRQECPALNLNLKGKVTEGRGGGKTGQYGGRQSLFSLFNSLIREWRPNGVSVVRFQLG
jgi:hypothetical protein